MFFEKEAIRLSETQDEFLLTVYAAVAQQEAVNVSRSVQWGFEKRFLRGIPKIAPILGYDMYRDNGEQVIRLNEAEAETVKQIFRWFVDGRRLTDIARDLVEKDIPTKMGHFRWTSSYVKYILTNQRYTGEVDAGAYPSTIAHIRLDQCAKKPIRIKNSHPQIINKSTFQTVQDILVARKRSGSNRPATKYPLSGRLICGYCKKNFHILSRWKNRRSWHCALRNQPVSGCSSDPLRETDLLSGIREAFTRRFGRSPNPVDSLSELLQYHKMLDGMESTRLEHIQRIISLDQVKLSAHSELTQRRNQAERAYVEFETRILMLEEDQSYFEEANNHLSIGLSWEQFLDTLSIPISRGWICQIAVYSTEILCIHWWDGKVTWTGSAQDACRLKPELSSEALKKHATIQNEPVPNVRHRTGQGTLMVSPLRAWRDHDFHDLYKTFTGSRKRTRVCAYCRVSTKEDLQTTSLAAQIAYYSHLIMGNPDWVFSGIYFDLGISGTQVENRPEFLRMVQDCRDGKIDRIITKSVSRFSRNALNTLQIARDLKSLSRPVSIYFENEGIDTATTKGEVVLSVCATLAQEESDNHSENVKWGIRNTVERGEYKDQVHNVV